VDVAVELTDATELCGVDSPRFADTWFGLNAIIPAIPVSRIKGRRAFFI
jgi:hypothetical protein